MKSFTCNHFQKHISIPTLNMKSAKRQVQPCVGVAYHCSAYYHYCMGKLYQSCNRKINGTCKGSGCKKSFRSHKTTIDKTISYRIFVSSISLHCLIALLIVTLVQSSFNSLVQHQLSLSYLFQKGLNGYNISYCFNCIDRMRNFYFRFLSCICAFII